MVRAVSTRTVLNDTSRHETFTSLTAIWMRSDGLLNSWGAHRKIAGPRTAGSGFRHDIGTTNGRRQETAKRKKHTMDVSNGELFTFAQPLRFGSPRWWSHGASFRSR